jgi:hypothetical protein
VVLGKECWTFICTKIYTACHQIIQNRKNNVVSTASVTEPRDKWVPVTMAWHVWRRLHNKELYAVYSSPNIMWVIKSRRLRWAGHVARMGERRGAYRALVGKPEGRRPLGRPRHGWEDNIKMDFREVGWGGVDWIDLAQDRDRWWAVVCTVMNRRVP